MLIQILPPAIMFSVTVIFVALFFVPAIRFRQKDKTTNFYWVGFWVFLGLLMAVSGGESTVRLCGAAPCTSYEVIITGLLNAFVFFVVFAWFRLFGTAAYNRYFNKP